MKKITIAIIIIGSAFACNKSAEPNPETPIMYYFKIEAVDNDGNQSTITTYKTVYVN